MGAHAVLPDHATMRPSRVSDQEEGPRAAERAVGEALDRLPVIAYRTRLDAMWTCDHVGTGIASFGFSPDQWIHDPGLWLRQIHPDDRERVARERIQASRTGCLTTDYRLRTATGEERWVHDRARLDTEGEATFAHGVLLDVSEQHAAERVVEHSFETAAERAEELQFTHTVDDTLMRLFGHDVRSPLAAASGLVTTLLHDPDQFEVSRRQELLERVQHALVRARELVEDLERNWGAQDAPAQQPTLRVPLAVPVDLCQVLADVVDEVVGPEDHVEVACNGVMVTAIPALLRRALVGMVRNAVVHTPEGTHVLVTAMVDDDGVVVMVEDDGPGIPSHAQATVFDPHVRLADGAGMGLGLALVREVAALHRGQAWVQESALGGTACCLLLPVVPDDPVALPR